MENFDLRKYLSDNALLKEHSEVENWDNMGEEERLYTLLKYIDDPDKAESYVDASSESLYEAGNRVLESSYSNYQHKSSLSSFDRKESLNFNQMSRRSSILSKNLQH